MKIQNRKQNVRYARCFMFTNKMQTLTWLAFQVVCCGLAWGQSTSQYHVMDERPVSWSEDRDFCRRHYVDLAVLATEEDYLALLNATAGKQSSFWLGMQRQSVFGAWAWVSGDELSYQHWYRRNHEGHCASLEAMLPRDKNLLARYCDEQHMFVCQGPIPIKTVNVDSVGLDHTLLSWEVSAFMQTTPHYYNVTACKDTCVTHVYSYSTDSALMKVSMANLTSATEYHVEISAFVFRQDSATGGRSAVQSNHAVLRVKTGHLKESDQVISTSELSLREVVIDLLPEKT